MNKIETERLILRRFTLEDVMFFRELLNDADWIRFIGDRNVHSDEQARAYLTKSYLCQYEKNGFGINLVALKDGKPIGMCGLLKRDSLDDVDIGFAFLPAYRGKGYAVEAARAVLAYGRDVLHKKRVVAITLADNLTSISLLEKIGMHFETMVRLTDDDDELARYAIDLQSMDELIKSP